MPLSTNLVSNPATSHPPHSSPSPSTSEVPNASTSTPSASSSARRRALSAAERKLRWINLGAVLLPFVGLIAAIVLTWGVAFDWVYLGILAGMSLATSLGITVGYHRLFTHKSFRTNAVVRFALAACGSMAVQGPVIEWAGVHRRHHQHSDDEQDPHSPHAHAGGSWGGGVWGTLKGMFHAHMGWLFAGRPKGLARYTKDLYADPVLRAVNKQFPALVLAGLVIPAVLGGLLTWSLMGVLLGFIWGGLVRIFFVHHITWSVNSVCHLWGAQPFRSHDHSRNNPIVGVLALGEGWHNNHHAFPTSARHGLRWWEFDASYLFIRGMALIGLASDVKVPDAERIASKRH